MVSCSYCHRVLADGDDRNWLGVCAWCMDAAGYGDEGITASFEVWGAAIDDAIREERRDMLEQEFP